MVRHQLHTPQQSHITAIFHTNIPYFPLLSFYHPHFPIFILHLPPTPPLLPFTNPSIYPTHPLFPAITYPTIYHYYPRLYPSLTPLLPNLPPSPASCRHLPRPGVWTLCRCWAGATWRWSVLESVNRDISYIGRWKVFIEANKHYRSWHDMMYRCLTSSSRHMTSLSYLILLSVSTYCYGNLHENESHH